MYGLWFRFFVFLFDVSSVYICMDYLYTFNKRRRGGGEGGVLKCDNLCGMTFKLSFKVNIVTKFGIKAGLELSNLRIQLEFFNFQSIHIGID